MAHNFDIKWQECLQGAAEGGHLDILKWISKEGYYTPRCSFTTLCCYGVMNGHWDVVKWLREIGEDWGYNFCFWATRAKRTDILLWAVANGYQINATALNGAALVGDIETIDYLIAVDIPLTTSNCEAAAKGGHLKTLKHLRKVYNCPWDSNTVRATIIGGCTDNHFEILKWAIKHGCMCAQILLLLISGPQSEDAVIDAVIEGNKEFVEYLSNAGYPFNTNACAEAANCGDLEMLKYLRYAGSSAHANRQDQSDARGTPAQQRLHLLLGGCSSSNGCTLTDAPWHWKLTLGWR